MRVTRELCGSLWLLSETLSVLEQPRCAIEYVLRPPLASDSDHEIVLVSPGEAGGGESNSFDEIRKGEQ